MSGNAGSQATQENGNDDRSLSAPAQKKAPVTPGPYRCVSKPGTFVTLFSLVDVNEKRDSVIAGNAQETIDSEVDTIGGYTFGVRCKLEKDGAGELSASFMLFLYGGQWDDYVDWPFAKKLTVILSHTEDQDRDVRLPVCTDADCELVKKPAPGCCNKGHWTKPVNWAAIEEAGFVVKGTLYVNVELE
ncbi:hypothetical protein HPB49_024607 [Dermacentor silvarum]|uniref:Uncharacterized protein n=1 Tax=Dermacentor silvarum TaxID=543639 RepID=A0ACB8DRJ8_DERSI|nr:hypothetical protein HPB49_024607 [Dermacentor silvarum]